MTSNQLDAYTEELQTIRIKCLHWYTDEIISKRGIRPKAAQIIDFILDQIPALLGEAEESTIGKIGAKLLAKHSPQAVIDAYFDAANEILEQHETNN